MTGTVWKPRRRGSAARVRDSFANSPRLGRADTSSEAAWVTSAPPRERATVPRLSAQSTPRRVAVVTDSMARSFSKGADVGGLAVDFAGRLVDSGCSRAHGPDVDFSAMAFSAPDIVSMTGLAAS